MVWFAQDANEMTPARTHARKQSHQFTSVCDTPLLRLSFPSTPVVSIVNTCGHQHLRGCQYLSTSASIILTLDTWAQLPGRLSLMIITCSFDPKHLLRSLTPALLTAVNPSRPYRQDKCSCPSIYLTLTLKTSCTKTSRSRNAISTVALMQCPDLQITWYYPPPQHTHILITKSCNDFRRQRYSILPHS